MLKPAYSHAPAVKSPHAVTREALELWDRYSAHNSEHLRIAFLARSWWLVENERRIGEDSGGWPLTASSHSGRPYLSALVQGQALSVLVRACMLTRDRRCLEVARRVAHTFERDILDGGVCSPLAEGGLFFEECATYPAAHSLNGMIVALLGLHDYLELEKDAVITLLLQKSHETLHRFLPEFDTGYWTRPDLLSRRLSSEAQLAQHICLMHSLAHCTQCEQCVATALRWRGYRQRRSTFLRARIVRNVSALTRTVWTPAQRSIFCQAGEIDSTTKNERLRVCVPITAFPVTGGMRTVVASIASVTSDIWRMEYLTQCVGPNAENLPVHSFGAVTRGPWLTAPWQFPFVWLYALAGARKLISLLRHTGKYALILPQDGVFTAAFAALVGRLAGIRVVCMDYGNLTWLHNSEYQAERRKLLEDEHRLKRGFGLLLLRCYWPSFSLLAWLSIQLVDHFLIAGVEGDGIEDVYCDKLGVPRSHITRYAYMIDSDHHPVFDAAARACARERYSVPSDALVITMICRLAPEKGVGIALESIALMLAQLLPEQRERVIFLLAGTGPLREQIEAEITMRGLEGTCRLLGEASSNDVLNLLGLCDIFLHTSTRGAFYSMTVLEAMASGCAIIASDQPPLNTLLLADERGIVVPAGDVARTADALVSLLGDTQRGSQMGANARQYIARSHSPTALARVLRRETHWSELDAILQAESIASGSLERSAQ